MFEQDACGETPNKLLKKFDNKTSPFINLKFLTKLNFHNIIISLKNVKKQHIKEVFSIILFFITLVTIFIIGIIAILHTIKYFKTELFYLKPLEDLYPQTTLNGDFNWLTDEECLLFFADPNCASCHPKLEELIYLNQTTGEIPCKVILIEEHGNKQEFIEHYSSFFNIQIVSSQTLNLSINEFPALVVVDKNGRIDNQYHAVLPAYRALKEGEKEIVYIS